MSSATTSAQLRAMTRQLHAKDKDLKEYLDGTLIKNQCMAFAVNLGKPLIAKAIIEGAAETEDMNRLAAKTRAPVSILKSGVTAVIPTLGTLTIAIELIPRGASRELKRAYKQMVMEYIHSMIGAVSSEKEALECLISVMIYLFPEGWNQDSLVSAAAKVGYELEMDPILPGNLDMAMSLEEMYKEIVAFMTLGLLMMGKNVGGDAVNISMFLQYRKEAIVGALGLGTAGDWGAQETARFISSVTDSKKPLRIYLFRYLLQMRAATLSDMLEIGSRLALEYLKSAFITTLSAVSCYILEQGYTSLILSEVRSELLAINGYIINAIALCPEHWTFVRMGVSEEDLRPLPASAFPVLARVAMTLAADHSSTISRVPTPKLTFSQSQVVAKLLLMIRTQKNHVNRIKALTAGAGVAASADFMDMLDTPADEYEPHIQDHVGPNAPHGRQTAGQGGPKRLGALLGAMEELTSESDSDHKEEKRQGKKKNKRNSRETEAGAYDTQ